MGSISSINNTEATLTWKEYEFNSFLENGNLEHLQSLKKLNIVACTKNGIETGRTFEAHRVDKDTFKGTVEFKDKEPLHFILMGDDHSYVATNID